MAEVDEGEQEGGEGKERAEWYGPWLSEKEDAGMWKVCAEVSVPLGARQSCKVREPARMRAYRDERGGRPRVYMGEL